MPGRTCIWVYFFALICLTTGSKTAANDGKQRHGKADGQTSDKDMVGVLNTDKTKPGTLIPGNLKTSVRQPTTRGSDGTLAEHGEQMKTTKARHNQTSKLKTPASTDGVGRGSNKKNNKSRTYTTGEGMVLQTVVDTSDFNQIIDEGLITFDTSDIVNQIGDGITISEEDLKSLKNLLQNANSDLDQTPTSQIMSALKVVMKNIMRLDERLLNTTKQTTHLGMTVQNMKLERQQIASEVQKAERHCDNIEKTLDRQDKVMMGRLKAVKEHCNSAIESQNGTMEEMREDIELLKTRESDESIKQKIEQMKSDIDHRLAGLMKQGKGLKNCGKLDRQATMLYAMWQKLYMPAESGTVRVSSANQSSVGWNGVSSRAIDGRKNTNYWSGTCMHTLKEEKPWLLLKLKGVANITGVELTNRGDCCHKRLSNFNIETYMEDPTKTGVKGSLCKHYSGTVGKAATILVPCENTMTALYIKISLRQKGFLTICEAVVKGDLLGKLSDKPTLQSSVTSEEGSSDRAVDGDKSTCSETMPEDAPWWQVDMREMVNVRTVYIQRRKGNVDSDLMSKNITVAVHRKLPSICAATTMSDICSTHPVNDLTLALTCSKPITGRYLQIRGETKGTSLSLCEVSVNDKKMLFG